MENQMTKRRKKATVKKYRLPRSIRRMFPKVEYAVDATSAIEVSVNKKDCESAEALNPMECALARAAKRELHVDGVIIGMSTSYVIKGNKATRYDTPESVAREIVSFDRHKDFSPGDYHLMPKPPSVRFGESRYPHAGGSGGKQAKRKIHTSARVRVLEKGSESYD
jgi:hypothetical protein